MKPHIWKAEMSQQLNHDKKISYLIAGLEAICLEPQFPGESAGK